VRARRTSFALRVVGVGVLVWLAWRRGVPEGVPGWVVAVVAGVLVGVVVAVAWFGARRERGHRSRVAVARPGLVTHGGWADASLAEGLRELEVDPGSLRTGSRVTLAWSDARVELLRGERVVAAVPWDQVWTISATTGRASSSSNPAVELVTRLGVRLVIVPARRPDGGLLPARTSDVDALVERLRGARRDAVEKGS